MFVTPPHNVGEARIKLEVLKGRGEEMFLTMALSSIFETEIFHRGNARVTGAIKRKSPSAPCAKRERRSTFASHADERTRACVHFIPRIGRDRRSTRGYLNAGGRSNRVTK